MRAFRPRSLALQLCTALLLTPGLAACDDSTGPGDLGTFRITIQNSAGALQPLTPSLVVLHGADLRIFRLGFPAGSELERIAESGNNEPLAMALEGMAGVAAVGTAPGPGGPILPGEEGSVELEGPMDARISLVSMLVCTNDGFTGTVGLSLPAEVGETVTLSTSAYDAGTEQNTEAQGDLVPPCVMATTGAAGGTGADQPEVSEDEVVRPHPGIDGDTDGEDILDAQHQWTDPVAMIEIERIG